MNWLTNAKSAKKTTETNTTVSHSKPDKTEKILKDSLKLNKTAFDLKEILRRSSGDTGYRAIYRFLENTELPKGI